jgi:hypothetical protein
MDENLQALKKLMNELDENLQALKKLMIELNSQTPRSLDVLETSLKIKKNLIDLEGFLNKLKYLNKYVTPEKKITKLLVALNNLKLQTCQQTNLSNIFSQNPPTHNQLRVQGINYRSENTTLVADHDHSQRSQIQHDPGISQRDQVQHDLSLSPRGQIWSR